MADLLGRYRYVELELFAIAGRGVLRSDDPLLTVQLSRASHAHAFRAELIERRLLVSDGLEHAAESTRSPGSAHERLLESLGNHSGRDLAAALVSAWYPAMLSAYQERLTSCDVASDGPVHLMLSRVIFDLEMATEALSRVGRAPLPMSEVALIGERLDEIGGPFGTPRL